MRDGLPTFRIMLTFVVSLAACGDNLSSGRDGGGGGGGGDGDGGSSLVDAASPDTGAGALTDGDECATADDCAEGSACLPDQSETSGICATTPCTPGDDDTCAPGGDGTCVDFDAAGGGQDPRCVDPCEDDGDCDAAQRCDETGDPQVDGTFCRHAEVGDACEDADDCGGDPWLCVTMSEAGAGTQEWTDGHCSLPCTGGCPDGTVCNDRFILDGGDPFCVVECGGALDTCERDPDYDCRDVEAAAGPTTITFGCAP